jgi:hypothetical protein
MACEVMTMCLDPLAFFPSSLVLFTCTVFKVSSYFSNGCR